MRWTYCALAAVLAGCGTDEDPRLDEPTFEVVTLTVLAPSCGQVQCHSTTTRTEELAFDTLDAARETMIDRMGIADAARMGRGLETSLWSVIIGEDDRMPPDSPLASHDITLVRTWLVAGAPGLAP